MPLPNNSVEYIDSTDFRTLEFRLTMLKEILDDNVSKLSAMRKLRYSEIDIEAEREKGRIQPDEIYVPQHIIDTNIRQEQAPYVQYIVQPLRSVICSDNVDPTIDLALLEQDLTKKLRYKGWEIPMFANIDAFQMNGRSVMQVVQDLRNPGGIGREMVSYADFAFINDTRNLQNAEIIAQSYYFTKTQLVKLKEPKPNSAPEDNWDPTQIDKILETEPSDTNINPDDYTEEKDRSLYRVQKIMFRVRGVVQVGWCCIGRNDDWARKPRPLFLGRRQLLQENKIQMAMRMMTGGLPPSKEQYETEYPYFLFPYLITENDTIDQLKGRVYLDQDAQEAVSSLLSSTLTQARRAAGMYFSKETSDPNDDVLIDKNVYFEQNCLINANVKAFKMDAPDPGIFGAIAALSTANKSETSQVAFAVNNRKDSRKTKKELDLAEDTQQQLSTIQVVLFSNALTDMYTYECTIIKSRVLSGVIQVDKQIAPLYQREYTIKPSGDTDVVEKEQMIQAMMGAWEVIQQTAAAPLFLADMLEKMFPANAAKYIKALQDGMNNQQAQQMQQMQSLMTQLTQMSQGIIHLSKHPEYFSETGQVHALPVVKITAEQIQAAEQQMKQQTK